MSNDPRTEQELLRRSIRNDIMDDVDDTFSNAAYKASQLEETVEIPDIDFAPEIDIDPTVNPEFIPGDIEGYTPPTSVAPAESISAQGFNGGGNSKSYSVGNPSAVESGLKRGTPAPGTEGGNASGEPGSEVGPDGSTGSGGEYDDAGGNGYSRNRGGNQRKKEEKPQDDKPEDEKKGDKKDPTGDDKKKGEDTGGDTAAEDPNKTKSKSDLDKEKEKEKAEDDAEEAAKRAATNATAAHGDPNADPNNPQNSTDKKTKDGENPEGEKKAAPDETGNGYGALDKKKQQSPTDNSDATARARRNLEHQNKVNNGNSKPASSIKKKTPAATTAKKGSPVKSALAKAGNGIKNKVKGLGKKKNNSNGGNKGTDIVDKGIGALKNAILLFMQRHPVISLFVILLLLLLIVFMIETMDFDSGGKGRGKRSCTYELNGVVSTGTVELSNLKVEIINCDGTASNYEVLDTVDFEKYILGVALAEAGPSSPDEALKAQMIAVRNFSLTRNSGMCPSHPDSCFHGYNASTGIIRMRACTNDQVYWDYTKDCPKIERNGKPTLYCEGVDGSTDIWKKALSEERQKEVEALANEVMGEVLLDENGNVLKLGYKAAETDKFIADANAGKSYVEILEAVYGSSSYSSAKCTYGGVFDYGDYTLSSENTSILHEPLDEFLEDNGTSLEEFNKLIADNVDDAGWGTRAGVVAAAVTLIGELGDNYGVKVPYYWGGGHYDGVVDGALGYWGSTQCHTYANNQHYNYCGFDCSGFVPWAIKNGGFKKGVDLANNFKNMPNARKVQLSNQPELQPGDLLESEGHIVLVVGIDEASGQYICAEAMGNAYGVLFTRRAFNESGYWGVDLEDYYNDPNYIREPIR